MATRKNAEASANGVYDPTKPAIAAVNIYGPDGDLCPIGAELPSAWSHDFINELLATGGASQGE